MSFINQMYGSMVINAPEPEIGQGATMLSYSDRHAGSVIEILKGGVICVQQDRAKVVKGQVHNGSAEYEYEANPEGPKYFFRRDANGRWCEVHPSSAKGRWRKGGRGLILGMRREYFDPSF